MPHPFQSLAFDGAAVVPLAFEERGTEGEVAPGQALGAQLVRGCLGQPGIAAADVFAHVGAEQDEEDCAGDDRADE